MKIKKLKNCALFLALCCVIHKCRYEVVNIKCAKKYNLEVVVTGGNGSHRWE
jgi:hypothetical protein